MPNRLKDIFSDNMFNLGGKIHFEDTDAHEQFLKALHIVWDEGKTVEVKGVTAVTTEVSDGDMVYPFLEQKHIDKFFVAPSLEEVPYEVNTKYGIKTVLFKRYQTNKEAILETSKSEVVYLKIVLIKDSSNISITYKTQPQLAKTVKDLVESHNTMKAVLDKFFINDLSQESSDEYALIRDMKENLTKLEIYYTKLLLLEQELDLTFKPANIGNTENIQNELEELNLLLLEKQAIRLNAKLTATESTSITMQAGYTQLEVGSKLDLTFQSVNDYMIYGQKISIHTANLLSNAIIRQFEEREDGTIKILYDDTDSQPMYISYMGFKTISEAEKELETIMEHKGKYTEALTLYELLNKTSDKKTCKSPATQ